MSGDLDRPSLGAARQQPSRVRARPVVPVLSVLSVLALAALAMAAARPAKLPPTIGDDLGIELVLLPGGSLPGADAAPAAPLRPFYLGVAEVTQAQWSAVMGGNPSVVRGDGLPVEWVSWDDCQEFLRRLSARDGRAYRLPSEAEWEYACRAGSADPDSDGTRATYEHRRGLDEALACPANRWGLRGMHGNVWEWCDDAMPDGRRAMRGGSCNLYPTWCPPDDRLVYPAGFRHERRGLRVALSAAR